MGTEQRDDDRLGAHRRHVVAAARAGALPFLAAGNKTPAAMEAELDAVRGATDEAFGMNVFVPMELRISEVYVTFVSGSAFAGGEPTRASVRSRVMSGRASPLSTQITTTWQAVLGSSVFWKRSAKATILARHSRKNGSLPTRSASACCWTRVANGWSKPLSRLTLRTRVRIPSARAAQDSREINPTLRA